MSNSIADLRAHLFDTIAALKAGTMEVEKAKAIGDIAQVVINSAKVEVDFLRVRDGNSRGTGFIPELEEPPGQPRLVRGNAHSGSR